jgi:hypothetical protein
MVESPLAKKGNCQNWDAEELRKSFGKTISEWHDKIKPKYIFLTETSATPLRYLIKEAWRTAYPNEVLPKFYRIDPESINTYDIKGISEMQDYISKRATDKNANVIVFDEAGFSGTGKSVRRVRDNLSGTGPRFGRGQEGEVYDKTKENYRQDFAVPSKNIFIYRG